MFTFCCVMTSLSSITALIRFSMLCSRPLSVIGFSDTNTPGAAYTESPIYVPEDKGFVEHEITPEDDDDNFQQVEDVAY